MISIYLSVDVTGEACRLVFCCGGRNLPLIRQVWRPCCPCCSWGSCSTWPCWTSMNWLQRTHHSYRGTTHSNSKFIVWWAGGRGAAAAPLRILLAFIVRGPFVVRISSSGFLHLASVSPYPVSRIDIVMDKDRTIGPTYPPIRGMLLLISLKVHVAGSSACHPSNHHHRRRRPRRSWRDSA